jgi:hypothetical protein
MPAPLPHARQLFLPLRDSYRTPVPVFGIVLIKVFRCLGLNVHEWPLLKKEHALLRFCIYVAVPLLKRYVQQFLARTIRPYLKQLRCIFT